MTIRFVPAFLLLAACLSLPATAMPLADMRADLLLQLEQDARQALTLTPNQTTLWQHLVARSKDLLRARQARREPLHADLKARLGAPDTELRALARLADAEAAQSAQEEKQLREIWLDMDDALDDRQRAVARKLLLDELERVAAPAGPGAREERQHGEGGRPGGRGGPGGRPGGMGAGRSP